MVKVFGTLSVHMDNCHNKKPEKIVSSAAKVISDKLGFPVEIHNETIDHTGLAIVRLKVEGEV